MNGRRACLCGSEFQGRARSALPTIPVPQSQIVNGRLIHVSQWGPLIPGITVMLMVRSSRNAALVSSSFLARPPHREFNPKANLHVRLTARFLPGGALVLAASLQAAGAVVLYLPEETQGRPLQDLAGDGAHHQARVAYTTRARAAHDGTCCLRTLQPGFFGCGRVNRASCVLMLLPTALVALC